jgi:hypothetical protein
LRNTTKLGIVAALSSVNDQHVRDAAKQENSPGATSVRVYLRSQMDLRNDIDASWRLGWSVGELFFKEAQDRARDK